MSTEPHAVRWARSQNRLTREPNYSKWHCTINGDFVLCGWVIPLALRNGTFFPDTSDDLSIVDCKWCKNKLALILREQGNQNER